MKSNILLIFLLLFAPFVLAAEVDFKIPDESPKIVFDWPSVKVESVKYHLENRFLNSESYEFPVLIKEKDEVELINGREGRNSKITLELWKLKTSSLDKKLWSITHAADTWRHFSRDEIVLIKYGCCDSLNEYSIYDFKTGVLNRRVKSKELPK